MSAAARASRSGAIRLPDVRYLAKAHADQLRASGIDQTYAETHGVFSSADPVWLGRVTGDVWTLPYLPALVFPYFDAAGLLIGYRARPEIPLPSSSGSKKYAQAPGSGTMIYLTPELVRDAGLRADIARTLVITEGEKKALAVAQTGLACIGLGGIWNAYRRSQSDEDARQLHETFNDIALRGRDVVIAFDSDVPRNPKNRGALYALDTALTGAGAKVRIADLPETP